MLAWTLMPPLHDSVWAYFVRTKEWENRFFHLICAFQQKSWLRAFCVPRFSESLFRMMNSAHFHSIFGCIINDTPNNLQQHCMPSNASQITFSIYNMYGWQGERKSSWMFIDKPASLCNFICSPLLCFVCIDFLTIFSHSQFPSIFRFHWFFLLFDSDAFVQLREKMHVCLCAHKTHIWYIIPRPLYILQENFVNMNARVCPFKFRAVFKWFSHKRMHSAHSTIPLNRMKIKKMNHQHDVECIWEFGKPKSFSCL